ncbi:GPI mannosyltransferase 2 [Schistocerca cancellata]|uniref:GPI mannosyltransferase 2 n=1 Tax=Schistocerca cancellata TaxID=274614 RepID=UPI002117CDF3|nr:GPI mannosyltransferase 2 [Schistocerca cancellata]
MTVKAFSLKPKVTTFAILSRLFVLILSCLSNNLIPDHNSDAFISPSNPHEKNATVCDSIFSFLFGGINRWDAQYFLHISRYGYTFENCLAFFPTYPILTYLTSRILYIPLSIILNETSVTTFCAVAINFYFFVKAAEVLYDLTEKLFKNCQLAYVASIMFCVNPASIFFSAPYSETLFSFFSFYGMYLSVSDHGILCSVPLGLSASVRSNGILNTWFPLFKIANNVFQRLSNKLKSDKRIVKRTDVIDADGSFMNLFLKAVLVTVISLAPFFAFQAYCYSKYCKADTYDIAAFLAIFAHEKDFVLPGSKYLPWCDDKLVLPYMYVQQHYWNVGFLRYYEFKQIPNFILAAPVVFLIFTMTFCFVSLHMNFNIRFLNLKVESSSGMPLNILPFIAHAAGLTIFCLLNIHVQVTTRMIASSSPVLYWFSAYILTGKLHISNEVCKKQDKKDVSQKKTKSIEFEAKFEDWWNILFVTFDIPQKMFSKFIKIYFISYLIIGTILFSNFYPWT